MKAEYSPLKPRKDRRVVSAPWLEGKKRVRDWTEGNFAGLDWVGRASVVRCGGEGRQLRKSEKGRKEEREERGEKTNRTANSIT